jgi:hypothetical protein
MIESPHAGGTVALAWAGAGTRYLATLSAAHEATVGGRQEVAVWDCEPVWAALRGEGSEGDPSPTLLASAPVPAGAGLQGALTANAVPGALLGRRGALGGALARAAHALAVATGAPVPCAVDTPGEVVAAWEMATSPGAGAPGGGAGGGVVFYSVVCARVIETRRTAGGGADPPTLHAVWHVCASLGLVPAALRGAVVPTVTRFLSGALAPPLTTTDALASSVVASALPGSVAAAKGVGRVLLSTPSAAAVRAVSGTAGGGLLQWVDAAPPPGGAGALSEASASAAKKTGLKLVKLSAPTFMALAAGGGGDPRVTALAPTPSGKHLLVGTGDGAVRLYDLHARLVAWWEDLAGGAVAALSFPIGARAPGALALPPGALPDAASLAALADVPPFVVATGRALAIGVAPGSFLLPDGAEARRGSILAEGPDSPVAAVAAFTAGGGDDARAPQQQLLAVALRSGTLQIWSPSSRTLLLVRELPKGGARKGFHVPTCLAADPHGRALAVGTSEGFLLLLRPDTLADAQAALYPAVWAKPVAEGGGKGGPPVTHLAFSADGLHLASADAGGAVTLHRYVRRRERVPAPGVSAVAASARLLARRPWEGLVPDDAQWVHVETDLWAVVGRVVAHGCGGGLAGLSFAPLPPPGAAHALLAGTPLAALALPPRAPPASRAMPGGSAGEPLWADDDAPPGAALPHEWTSALSSARHAAAGVALLASVGAGDKKLVVYDVGSSSVARGLRVRPAGGEGGGGGGGTPSVASGVRGASREGAAVSSASGAAPPPPPPPLLRVPVEQLCTPTAVAWLPPAPGGAEDLKRSGAPPAVPPVAALVVANDAFKLRVWDVAPARGARPACVRTSASPAFGGALTALAALPAAGGDGRAYALAYATNDRVLGLSALPLDGSPYGVVGVAAHGGPVTAFAAAADGGFLFSASAGGEGGEEREAGVVLAWRPHEGALRALCASAPPGVQQFASALEGGGAGGEEHNAVCDGFVYAQLQAQGEACSAPRAVGAALPLPALPSLLRGLGFYPTRWEEALLLSEAAACAGASGELSLPDVIRLFVNARPARAVSAADVQGTVEAFVAAGGLPMRSSGGGGGGGVRWGDLAELLRSAGERLPAPDVDACMATLLGSDADAGGVLLTRQLAAATAAVSAAAAAARGGKGGAPPPATRTQQVLPRVPPPAELAPEQLLAAHTFAALLALPGGGSA